MSTRDIAIGTPCVIVWTGPQATHLLGHYCEVTAHVFGQDGTREYMVLVKSDGREWGAIRKNLLPVPPDDPLDHALEDEELTV